MHLVMPWFFPLAAFVAWLGVRSARELRAEAERARTNALWMLIVMFLPLLIWLANQVMAFLGIPL